LPRHTRPGNGVGWSAGIHCFFGNPHRHRRAPRAVTTEATRRRPMYTHSTAAPGTATPNVSCMRKARVEDGVPRGVARAASSVSANGTLLRARAARENNSTACKPCACNDRVATALRSRGATRSTRPQAALGTCGGMPLQSHRSVSKMGTLDKRTHLRASHRSQDCIRCPVCNTEKGENQSLHSRLFAAKCKHQTKHLTQGSTSTVRATCCLLVAPRSSSDYAYQALGH
jgi:hypothetical protein